MYTKCRNVVVRNIAPSCLARLLARHETVVVVLCMSLMLGACDSKKQNDSAPRLVTAPTFSADSAKACIEAQCAFGPRVPGTDAHNRCGDYIVQRFRAYGLSVVEQNFTATAWNGDRLLLRNIIASLNPEADMRLLVSAHWDSRPWADNDLDARNHRKPVLAANDGASGVAVMIELARTLHDADLEWGVDFVCFDGEDYGVARWTDKEADDSWCLGSKHWALQPCIGTGRQTEQGVYDALWGVNLDMVGGRGARFLREGISMHYAPDVVTRFWRVAAYLGHGDIFTNEDGGYVTDDHVAVNRVLGIPTIDIIPYYKDCERSSFGPTWHTVDDTPENIDKGTLGAVGKVVGTMICNP